jgi:hypothetical protein
MMTKSMPSGFLDTTNKFDLDWRIVSRPALNKCWTSLLLANKHPTNSTGLQWWKYAGHARRWRRDSEIKTDKQVVRMWVVSQATYLPGG